jgi:hypothetical protein
MVETIKEIEETEGGNQFFNQILIHSKSNMVGTRLSHPMIPPASALGVSNNQEMMNFMKHIAESMEVMGKRNEDLNTRLIVAEARSNQREREREERRKKERQDNVCRGKWTVAPGQQDNKKYSPRKPSHNTE